MAVTVKRISFKQVAVSGSIPAASVSYDNTVSGLSASDVQAAIDELAATGSDGQAFTFNIGSWSGPTIDNTYEYTVLFTSHNKTNPTINTFELVVSDYQEVETFVLIDSSNNVIISVSSIPDLRFIGKIIIT